MPYYSDWDSLVTAAQKKAKPILKNYVTPEMIDHVIKHMRTDVYDAYSSKHYRRRYSLINKAMYRSMMIDESTLVVYTLAKANRPLVKSYKWSTPFSGSFSYFVNGGQNGNKKWFGIWKEGFPRPAITLAENSVSNNNKILKAIREGIDNEIST